MAYNQGYGASPYGEPNQYGDYGAHTESSHPSDKYFTPLHGQQQTYMVQCANAQENHKFKFAVRKADEGVRIIDITPGGPFHRAGVPCGRLLSINNIPVHDKESVTSEIHKLQGNGVTRFPVVVVPDPTLPVPPPYKPGDFGHDAMGASPVAPPSGGYGGYGSGGAAVGVLGGAGPGGYGSPQRSDETMDEFLSRKLHKISQDYKNGLVSEQQYQGIKDQILAHFNVGKAGAAPRQQPHLAPYEHEDYGPPAVRGTSRRGREPVSNHAKSMPACPWAETCMRRYIYLRVGPGRGYNWVSNGGVFGVVKALHCVGEWVFVRTDAGTEGYIRDRHLNYLPHGPKSSQMLRSLDLLDAGGYDVDPRAPHQADDVYDPYSGRYLPSARRPAGRFDDAKATSLSPPRYIRRRYLAPDVHVDEDLGEDFSAQRALPYSR